MYLLIMFFSVLRIPLRKSILRSRQYQQLIAEQKSIRTALPIRNAQDRTIKNYMIGNTSILISDIG